MDRDAICSLWSGTALEARDYQINIVDKVNRMFLGCYVNGKGVVEGPSRSVMIQSPTGSGKTSMGLMVGKALSMSFPDIHFGWVAMRQTLLSQAARENAVKGIGLSNISFVSMFDKYPSELMAARLSGKKVGFIVDECQHDATSSMAAIHALVKPEMVIGLTATPYRTDKMKLCFDRVVTDCGIHQLIQAGFLSRFDHYTIDKYDVRSLFDLYCRYRERWGKSIFYFHSIAECDELAALLNGAGVSAETVSGTSDVDRQLEDFASGRLKVLLNCQMLTEGSDFPDLQTVFVRDSGRGPTVQMAGRVLRKHASVPVKNVVQSKNTRWPFLKTAKPAHQFLRQDNQWLSLTANPRIDDIARASMMAIAVTNNSMPSFIADRLNKKKRRVGGDE